MARSISAARFCGRSCGPCSRSLRDSASARPSSPAITAVGWPGAILGCLLCRVFDIVKPPPARQFERLRGGIGVMADDAMAAIYANLALRAAIALGNRIIW